MTFELHQINMTRPSFRFGSVMRFFSEIFWGTISSKVGCFEPANRTPGSEIFKMTALREVYKGEEYEEVYLVVLHLYQAGKTF